MTQREHITETLPSGGLRCTVCEKSFPKGKAWGDCPGVIQYEWGNAQHGLFTAGQLKKMRLIPGAPVGALFYSKSPDGWLWLYRKEDAAPKRALTDKQLAQITKMQAGALAARTCQRCNRKQPRKHDLSGGLCEQCQIARLAEEWLQQDFVVLDCETTGLDRTDEIVALSVIDKEGNVLLDSYIKPQKPIIEEMYSSSYDDDWHGPRLTAFGVNGISNELVKDAPSFFDISPQLMEITRGKLIIAYNVQFDRMMVKSHIKRYGLSELEAKGWNCAMEAFAQFYGDYSYKYRDYRYQSLSSACSYMEVEHSAPHESAADCQATLRLLHSLAAWMPVSKEREN